jgi:hypothetical protein
MAANVNVKKVMKKMGKKKEALDKENQEKFSLDEMMELRDATRSPVKDALKKKKEEIRKRKLKKEKEKREKLGIFDDEGAPKGME